MISSKATLDPRVPRLPTLLKSPRIRRRRSGRSNEDCATRDRSAKKERRRRRLTLSDSCDRRHGNQGGEAIAVGICRAFFPGFAGQNRELDGIIENVVDTSFAAPAAIEYQPSPCVREQESAVPKSSVQPELSIHFLAWLNAELRKQIAKSAAETGKGRLVHRLRTCFTGSRSYEGSGASYEGGGVR
jgi:hypothetical protein